MKLETSAEVVVGKPVESVFDFSVADGTFARVLRAKGPIPGIVSVEVEGGGPQKTGTRRKVSLTDESTLSEEVLLLDRPREHRYRWITLPPPPFSFLIKGGEASWTFHAEGAGTRVRWHYAFELTSPLALPVMLVVRVLFTSWMQQGLNGLRDTMGA